MGPPVGYKAGFTGQATQERFGIPSLATGVLFASMFVEDGGSLKRDFGHCTIIEPDLMVVVKDAGTMDATTELEAAAHLDTVHAYMELAPLQFAKGEKHGRVAPVGSADEEVEPDTFVCEADEAYATSQEKSDGTQSPSPTQ